MTDKRPDALRLAALLEKTGAKGSLRDEAAAELRRLHAELETMRAKLKTHEDLGDAGSDARLNGLAGRITGALNALAEDQVKGGES